MDAGAKSFRFLKIRLPARRRLPALGSAQSGSRLGAGSRLGTIRLSARHKRPSASPRSSHPRLGLRGLSAVSEYAFRSSTLRRRAPALLVRQRAYCPHKLPCGAY